MSHEECPWKEGFLQGSWLGWHRLLETSCPLCKAWLAGTSDIPPSRFFLTHIFTRHMPNATCSARHSHACSFRYNLHPGTEVKTTSFSSYEKWGQRRIPGAVDLSKDKGWREPALWSQIQLLSGLAAGAPSHLDQEGHGLVLVTAGMFLRQDPRDSVPSRLPPPAWGFSFFQGEKKGSWSWEEADWNSF